MGKKIVLLVYVAVRNFFAGTVLEIEPGASLLLDKHSAIEL